MPRIKDHFIKNLEQPESGNRIYYDDLVKGFGIRVTATGAKSFVLRYVIDGHERRMTLGSYPALSVTAAKEIALKLRGKVADGFDPLETRNQAREAPTMRNLAADYLERHATPFKRASSIKDDRSSIDHLILPKLGAKKVASVRRRDIEALHQSLKKTPYRANRVLALLSKMFSLAVTWDWRPDNPCRGVKRFQEEPRTRWLSSEEIGRLAQVLAETPNRRAANAIRLLMLTGARRSEVLGAKWDQFDLQQGIWTKPSAHTKQKKEERVPLSAPAMALLQEIRAQAGEGTNISPYVFPGDAEDKPLQDIKKGWRKIQQAAGLESVRLHDLRHTYASHLVSSGLSLEMVGRLLGHTQASTTQRYAHLADDPLREATNRFGATVEAASGKRKSAEVISIQSDS